MAKQVFDSPDLIRLIYSFGTPEHRTFTQTLKGELESQAINFDEHFQKNRDIYPDITTCLDTHSKQSMVKYVRSFSRCFCCSRHTKYKPNLSKDILIATGPSSSVFDNYTTGCDCPCRSLARNFISNMFRRGLI
jgi:hypothetical protein